MRGKQKVTQKNEQINSHVETYLNYYCNLSPAPGFAILLKGKWGSGKTWFIKNHLTKLIENNYKFLYISLYGMVSFSEIEDAFFQQLHPVLSSKGMAIAGKIFKGFLKGTLKIDLNNDSKDDGTWTIGIPEINIPDYLKNADKSILIFDDLERCKIDISNLLGYINYFVEHQDLKVIIIANEDEILEQDNSLTKDYQKIKEKLIGKTFGISPDLESALEKFIIEVNNSHVSRFLYDNIKLIEDLYQKAEYENLRNLKQIVLDFERIFKILPEKAKNKPEFIQDILKLLMVFSIEIKRGKMLPKDIIKLGDEYSSLLKKQLKLRQKSNSLTEENSIEKTNLEEILSKYRDLNLQDPFPSKVWWSRFFDTGILDDQELEQSLLNSKYFQDENTPIWVRLWHFSYLNDDEFEKLLEKLELQYAEKYFSELGIIKHITGLFLKFSDAGLYQKSKEDILEESKLYIDYLIDNKKLFVPINRYVYADNSILESYAGLGYKGQELEEFREFCSYIEEVQKLKSIENMPNAAQDLLAIMQNEVWKFYNMICISNSSEQVYYDIPILTFIEPSVFVEKFILMKFDNQQCVGWAFTERYKFKEINKKLYEELTWLKSVRELLLEEVNRKKGKVSGYSLKLIIEHSLNEAIQKLEQKEPS